MPFTWTTSDLISSIKTRAMIPTSQITFTNEDLLSLADEELQTVIFPMMMSVKGDYFVTNDDQTITSAAEYPIPPDAIGLKIKDCFWIDPSDSELREIQIPQVNLSDVTNQYIQGWTWGFYIQNNSVILTPNQMTGMTLRQKYYRRASKLIETSAAGQIVSINTGTNEITLSNVPTTWAIGDDLSAVDQNPGFLTLASGLTIVAVTSPVVEIADVSLLSVGDWICLDGDSPIAQIAPEAQPILAQSVAIKCLEALNDPGLVSAQQKFEQIKSNFIQTMTPRVDNQAKKIVNRSGTLAWKKIGRWGWSNG